MFCEVCAGSAALVCSGCKNVSYCSAECQNADWKTHKDGCKKQQLLDQLINNPMKAREQAERAQKPAQNCCTGCRVKFTEDYRRAGACPHCGYTACESCICHNSRGTCYCTNSNFGHKYCTMEPASYHADGRTGKRYTGDRHPTPYGEPYPEDAYEPAPRACKNCGEMKKILLPDFVTVMLHGYW